ncbi:MULTISPECIES: hypothetical protein [unclassified Novosphingobium]|uniref:hypothetical protein n=1 Tax=unclassified Novosphingobium TaxID=2644732 RepID=UPI0025D85DFC|nr:MULTISPECIES: hypothetical protein [unclassified Novosphingobium]HQV03700.1 hypothetical protein [Novosphingobium sp.]
MSLTAAASALENHCFGCRPPLEPITDLIAGFFGITLATLVIAASIRVGSRLTSESATLHHSSSASMLTREFRRKLIYWFSSMSILAFATVLGLCVTWFVRFPKLYIAREVSHFPDYMAFLLASNLELYAFAFVPVIIWHLADFIATKPPKRRVLEVLTSYALLSGILVCFGMILIGLATDWFTVDRPCGGMFLLLMQSCAGPHPVMGLPMRLLLLLFPILAILKLAVSLHSRLGRQR